MNSRLIQRKIIISYLVKAGFFFLDNELYQAVNSDQKDSATEHEEINVRSR